MDGIDWKMTHVNAILGLPHLDPKYMPAHVVIALKDRISKVPGVGALILYGSIVRGEASPKSDIDIMIIPMKNEDAASLKRTISKILRDLETEYNLPISFSPVIFTGEEDSYFLWEVAKDGAVIFIRPELAVQPPANMTPYALISYSFSGLSATEKKKVQRYLFESKDRMTIDKDNKLEYVAPGVLLLSMEKANKVARFFETNNVKHSLVKVWR